MKHLRLFITAYFLCIGLIASAQEQDGEELIQGLYEGIWKDTAGSGTAEVRVAAMGEGTFKLLARRNLDGEIVRAELDGKAGEKSVTFSGTVEGESCNAVYSGGSIKGTIGDNGKLTLKRILRNSPTLGKKSPEGAIQMVDGKNFDNMKPGKGEWLPADEKDGSIQVPNGGMSSIAKFEGSFDAHVEFMNNLRSKARGQGRGNSGTHLPNGNEIQVLDSFGAPTYLGGGCGGIYRFKNPDTMEPIPSLEGKTDNLFNLSSLPPEQWQTYDIEYRVKTGNAGKKKVSLTVYHNGIKIHDAIELRHGKGSFRFSDHGNPVRYKNVWLKEL